MASYYTHYWGKDGFAGAKLGEPVEYASSGVFRERKVREGDTLYIVTMSGGQLTLLGRFPVARIVTNRAEARQLLGREPWEGAEHAFARPGTGSAFDDTRHVPLETVRKLNFVTPLGVRSLKFKDASRLDQQTLRGVRQLTPESASLLEALLREKGRENGPPEAARRTITIGQIEAAYEVAVRAYGGEIGVEAAARELRDKHGLNVNSARDFISDYRLMLQGKVFQRAMSAPAMEYFLSRIWQDLGNEALLTSLSAVKKHIEYYEGISKSKLHSMRRVVDGFSARVQRPVDISAQEEAFKASVQKSLRDSSAARRARLKMATKTPAKASAIVQVYVRNPDVVAEVLARADGTCERCLKPAPFRRKLDGSPYLEVHHRLRLAEGGDDSVENATALCPNCHRELHFGQPA